MENMNTAHTPTRYQVSELETGTLYATTGTLEDAERLAKKYHRSTKVAFKVLKLDWATFENYDNDLVADTVTTVAIIG